MFKHPELVRHLVESMKLANSCAYGSQYGVYGYCHSSLSLIIRSEFGEEILSLIQKSRSGFNFGAHDSWYDDVVAAIKNAQELIDAEANNARLREKADNIIANFSTLEEYAKAIREDKRLALSDVIDICNHIDERTGCDGQKLFKLVGESR